ncbi:hypothetical protein SAMN06265360_10856 [Haloechinothrix alba]|uniref:PH domain-containing protein n=1 Tax=Haloechinothrix alba TaxID=664784 RepID=A0A238X0J3_9PSEU|nr:hypothetical protein [Haloechinothrix alba]SNR51399.1 hypothetical protein SAMN06265360_10856 [Haloechinothrix alba]
MERFLLSMLMLAVFLLLAAGMWWGWRRQAREDGSRYAPFPEVPEQLDADAARDSVTGVYVATTSAGHWQDRIVARGVGMRSSATLRRYTAGVVVARTGAPSFFIPSESLVDARTSKGMAGKVMGVDGLLVITWRLGDALVDTGFRADDKSVYARWIHALRAAAPERAPWLTEDTHQQRSIEGRAQEK